jgi:hypothetical protein
MKRQRTEVVCDQCKGTPLVTCETHALDLCERDMRRHFDPAACRLIPRPARAYRSGAELGPARRGCGTRQGETRHDGSALATEGWDRRPAWPPKRGGFGRGSEMPPGGPGDSGRYHGGTRTRKARLSGELEQVVQQNQGCHQRRPAKAKTASE